MRSGEGRVFGGCEMLGLRLFSSFTETLEFLSRCPESERMGSLVSMVVWLFLVSIGGHLMIGIRPSSFNPFFPALKQHHSKDAHPSGADMGIDLFPARC